MNIFQQLFRRAGSCETVRSLSFESMAIFEKENISQDRVATRLRCGGIFNYCFTVMESRDTVLCVGLGLVSTLVCLVLALSQVSKYCHVSCLMSMS